MNHKIIYEATCIGDDLRRLYVGKCELTPLLYHTLTLRLQTIRDEALKIKDSKFDNSNLSTLEPNK